MLLEYGELQTVLLVDSIPVRTFCFAATNERGIIVAIRKLQLPWDPGDSLTFDMIHEAAYIHLLQMLLMLPWDPGGCAIIPGELQVKSLSMQHINSEGRTLSKRTIVHPLYLCLPWDPGGLEWFRLEGKPKIMEGGMSATWTLLGLQPLPSPARCHKTTNTRGGNHTKVGNSGFGRGFGLALCSSSSSSCPVILSSSLILPVIRVCN